MTATDNKQEFMLPEEAGAYLRVTDRKVSLYRRYGLLKWARLGRNFVYKREWLDEFMNEWCGYDLSSEKAIRLAVNSRKWKEAHSE